ncbi:hypothetical protein [Enterobacter soli]|uniref:hypothetical protein n=1 Tax=Enterobacter soli TaxID=885040 RepID=UPI0034CFBD8B
MSDLLSNIDKRPYRADGGDISTGRLKEIADNPLEHFFFLKDNAPLCHMINIEVLQNIY